jgi:hypothetical protein
MDAGDCHIGRSHLLGRKLREAFFPIGSSHRYFIFLSREAAIFNGGTPTGHKPAEAHAIKAAIF